MTVATAAALGEIAAMLREVATAEVMPRFRRLAAGEVHAKSGPLDLVTAADEAAEREITAWLHRRHRGAVVIGEEAAAADPSLLDHLADADLSFVVDPIDGTSNYVAGVPLFGMMVAAIRRGEVVAAIIHDPLGDDTAFALRGEGAWIEAADGRRNDLRVAARVPVERMTGAASWRFLPEVLKQIVCGNLPRLAACWDFRCAAHEYRMLAAGHCHFLLFHRLMPWDHAPGWLLHAEAGGFSARFDGSAYSPMARSGGLICTTDRESWRALRAALLES